METSAPVETALHRLQLLPDMGRMVDTVIADVERARRRVYVECYIYRSDKLGRGFGEVLVRAARRGVDVRLLYDPLGSEQTDPAFFEELQRRGVQVRRYRPFDGLLHVASLAPRDHSRTVVIDDVAYTGGAAWGDEWLPRERGGAGWHDMCHRIEGPVVGDFDRLFRQRWAEARWEKEHEEPRDYDTGDRFPDLRLVGDTPARVAAVYQAHAEAFAGARRRIWIANAYFVPPGPLLARLYAAAARGVEVQILLPSHSDLPVARRAARASYGEWLARGLRVFEWNGVMMHAKYAVVDDDWCSIGTFNANAVSVGLANEVNLFVYDPTFVAAVAAQYQRDRAGATEITREEWRSRGPLDKLADDAAADAFDVADLLWGPPR